MKQAEAKTSYTDGQECIGVYMGKAFDGKLRGSRCRPTPDGRNMIFVIDLDYPINVYGQPRESVEIWTNDSNTLYFK